MVNISAGLKILAATITLAGMLATNISASASDRSDEELLAHIRARQDQYMEAFNMGDATVAAALYTEDAVYMGANMPTARGREEIAAANVAELDGPKLTLTTKTWSVERHGDIAFELGDWTMLIEPEGAEAITDHGDYVVIWKRQANSEWLMEVDIFNSNVPLAQ